MKYKVKEEVFDIDLEEKKICLDSNSGKYLELNESAALIFEFLKAEDKSVDQIVEHISNIFDVERDKIHFDVKELLENSKNIFEQV